MAGLDDSRSVMEEMIALFTPPGRETKSKLKKLELHPYYKRPGKGHNHDSCDACGEGGDLICCDNCPASFHFSCHAPPLEEEDIPMGDWTCLRCYHREQLRLAAIGAQVNSNLVGLQKESNAGSEPVRDVTTGPSEEKLPDSKISKSRNAKTKKQLEAVLRAEREKKVKVYRQKYDVYLQVKPFTNSPFDALIAAAQVSNAEQFKLPHELESREALPFSWKWSEERQDDFDSNPKTCFSCRKTCRGVPSIGCDYCVCVFHLDCLDPPLCEIPKERWMCPNHVEHFLDSNLVSSTSVTERLKIWQKYARGPINPDSVRLEFFRKARTGKLFRSGRNTKITKPVENRIKVPGYIKQQYRNRVTPFPIEHSEILAPVRQTETGNSATNLGSREMTNDEKDWLLSVISLQTSILKSDAKNEAKNDVKPSQKLRAKRRKVRRKTSAEKFEKPSILTNGDAEMSGHSDGNTSDADSVSTASECSLGLGADDDETLTATTQDELREYLAMNAKYGDIDRIDSTVLKFLAAKKLAEIFPKPIQVNAESEVRARAALVPLYQNSRAQPCLMRYRTLEIGSGCNPGLNLSSFGTTSCNYVSNRHASIFFDQFSRTFELINYSEHGTVVDNLIYTLDKRDISSSEEAIPRMSATNGHTPCYCSESPAKLKGSSDQGCEASAVLRHGSYIRFGCLQFVFTVTDNDDKAEDDDILKLTKKLKIKSREKNPDDPAAKESELPKMEEDSADE